MIQTLTVVEMLKKVIDDCKEQLEINKKQLNYYLLASIDSNNDFYTKKYNRNMAEIFFELTRLVENQLEKYESQYSRMYQAVEGGFNRR